MLRCHPHRALSAIAALTSPHDRGWWLTWDFCEIAPPSLLSAECSTSQSRPEQIKAAFLQGKVVDPMKDDFLILNVGVADLRGTGQRFYTFDHRRTYAMVRAGCLTARFRIRLRGPSFDEWLLGDCGFVAEQALRATILIRVPKSRQHVCFNALVVDLNFEKSAEVEQLSIPFVLMRDADVDTHVFQHLDTGIKVWSHALELTLAYRISQNV